MGIGAILENILQGNNGLSCLQELQGKSNKYLSVLGTSITKSKASPNPWNWPNACMNKMNIQEYVEHESNSRPLILSPYYPHHQKYPSPCLWPSLYCPCSWAAWVNCSSCQITAEMRSWRNRWDIMESIRQFCLADMNRMIFSLAKSLEGLGGNADVKCRAFTHTVFKHIK